ncbi:hypothetical protein ACQY1Q_10260 [Tenacibaculum sp. TC6]|uniref:hypothetical protein n=1 Tax=Tenacibaculum sp. TC6 TaxID=3423223 RepID=UPI003D366774
MSKYILAYFFITLMVITVALPTYVSLCEEKCETSLSIDAEKDTDEAINKVEIKFLCANDVVYSYQHKTNQKKLPYLLKVYTSIDKKQECPPPELL